MSLLWDKEIISPPLRNLASKSSNSTLKFYQWATETRNSISVPFPFSIPFPLLFPFLYPFPRPVLFPFLFPTPLHILIHTPVPSPTPILVPSPIAFALLFPFPLLFLFPFPFPLCGELSNYQVHTPVCRKVVRKKGQSACDSKWYLVIYEF